ncbi:MAG: tryptophan synthase subunit alpha [Candidatus Omnitrophica bacterium]|nr:tryptophan synthase subunit alpha [Candidatus Omnitrophota bacterium]
MEPLRAAFERLRRQRRKALVPFIMGGDPDLRATPALLLALQAAGADVIEIGVPFSDPLADGPVIQAASARALARGATPANVLRAIASAAPRLRVPVVCLTYWNPVIQFGFNPGSRARRAGGSPARFLTAAKASGVSGLIVPDLPVEEGDALRRAAARAGLAAVFLAAPTSPPQRLRRIARASEGFIYYVSVTGTTGMRAQVPPSLVQGIRQLRVVTTKPVCVGFGISTPAQAAAVARVTDGVIIGSALIHAMQQGGGRAGAIRAAARFVARMRKALDA